MCLRTMAQLSIKNLIYISICLILFFILTGIIGIVLISIGKPYFMDQRNVPVPVPVVYGIIVTSIVLIFVFSIVGFYVLKKDVRIVYRVYGLVLLAFATVLIVIAWLGVKTQKHDISTPAYKERLEEILIAIGNDELLVLQQDFQCCGITGPEYWNIIPPECCKDKSENCNIDSSDFFKESCRDAWAFKIKWAFNGIIYLIFAMGLTGILLACAVLYIPKFMQQRMRRNVPNQQNEREL